MLGPVVPLTGACSVRTACRSPKKKDSDFFVDLPQTLLMPERTGFYLDDISIPVSWYPIEAGRNNKLYIELLDQPMEYLFFWTQNDYN